MSDMVQSRPATVSALHPLIKQISSDATVEQLALTLIGDLKKLCEIYKEVGDEEFRNKPQIGIRTTCSYVLNGPYKGTYSCVGLGEGWLNFGFLAKPVAEYLWKRFTERASIPPVISVSEYDTRMNTIRTSGTEFITPDGVFSISYTYAWFIGRRVD